MTDRIHVKVRVKRATEQLEILPADHNGVQAAFLNSLLSDEAPRHFLPEGVTPDQVKVACDWSIEEVQAGVEKVKAGDKQIVVLMLARSIYLMGKGMGFPIDFCKKITVDCLSRARLEIEYGR